MTEPQPRIGVAVLVEHTGLRPKILLGQSKKITTTMDTGNWVVPGGGLRRGETIAECAGREIVEEAGLETVIVSEAPYDVYEIHDVVNDDHRVIVVVNAYTRSPALTGPNPVPALVAGDDLADVGWFTRAQIASGVADLTPFTKKLLKHEGWL